MVTARAFALVAGSLLAVAVPTARPAVSRSPRAGDRVRIVGGSAAERRLARLVALRVGGVTLRTVRFQTPERALPHMHVRGAEMVVSSSEPKTVRGEWELHLYAGVFTALNARYRVPLGAINAGERVGPVRLWPTFDLYSRVAKSIQVALLRQRLVVMASRLGARVAEFRVASTPARAIALTLQVSDPAAFLKHRAIRFLNILYRTDASRLLRRTERRDGATRLGDITPCKRRRRLRHTAARRLQSGEAFGVRREATSKFAEVPICKTLCFVAADWSLFAQPIELGGAHILWPRALVTLVRRDGSLDTESIRRSSGSSRLRSQLPSWSARYAKTRSARSWQR